MRSYLLIIAFLMTSFVISGCDDDDDDNVTPIEDSTVSVARDTYAPGDVVVITYEKPAERRAWVGVYNPGDDDRDYLDYQWAERSVQKGEVSWTIEDEGTYEARIFIDGGYDRLAVSETFTVTR